MKSGANEQTTRPLRVLYVHHAGPFGGASRSLFELIRAFPSATVCPLVLTKSGQFQQILLDAGIDAVGTRGVSQLDNSLYSHYRGFRWLVVLREILFLPATFYGLLAAKRRWGAVDVVHVNEITLLPVIWMVAKLFSCPLIVHVRSVQRPLSDRRGRLLKFLVKKHVSRLIAIDETVRRSLDKDLDIEVVHNGLIVSPDVDRVVAEERSVFTLGMVGGLSRAKGCLEFLAAAKICRDRGIAAKFVFVGQSMRPPSGLRDWVLRRLGMSQEIYGEMQQYIRDNDLSGIIEFRPFTTNLSEVYRSFDVICFPSHFDAPGRPIFEAAFFRVPAIAAITRPTNDTIIDGLTGLTVQPRDPLQLADAIAELHSNPQRRVEMGNAAFRLAERHYSISENAKRVLDIYRQCLAAQPANAEEQKRGGA